MVKVNGNFDDAFTKSLEAAEEPGSYTVNSVNPFRIEGQKTIPYRALEYLNWEVPIGWFTQRCIRKYIKLEKKFNGII